MIRLVVRLKSYLRIWQNKRQIYRTTYEGTLYALKLKLNFKLHLTNWIDIL